MRTIPAAFSFVSFIVLAALTASAQSDPPPQYLHLTNTDGTLESGWVISFPTGSSDYFNERFDFSSVRLIAGVGIGSADFASGESYPAAGLFAPNLSVDSSGNTPDLSTGVTTGPVPGGGAVYNYVFGSFGDLAGISGTRHVVIQLPPGDSGLLGLGASSDHPNPATFSGWTMDGYATPAIDFSETADWGLNAEVDRVAELQAMEGYHAALHEFTDLSDETGDMVDVTVAAGDDYGMVLHTSAPGAFWMLYLSFIGIPTRRSSPPMPTFPWGGGGYFRAGTAWPIGHGGFTLDFVAIAGVPGIQGSAHISNEVTVRVLPDPDCHWGIKDDGSFETGWVVQIPEGSSDYFSNFFNCGVTPDIKYVTDFKLMAMDFGAGPTKFPVSGVFAANLDLDPSGWTPDLKQGWGVQPFTYPGYETSSGFTGNDIDPDIPYSTFPDDNVHGVIQMPPGDSGLIGIGGDTTPSPAITWGSHWTIDGWATPTNRFDATAGLGIRLGSK